MISVNLDYPYIWILIISRSCLLFNPLLHYAIMKVILLQNVSGTGEKGEVKEVSDGYARNFLLQKGLARQATSEALASLKMTEEKKKRENEKELALAQKLAGKLDGAEIEVKGKVSAGGTLYAAIKAETMTQGIKKQFNLTVSPSQIKFTAPIKDVGEHHARIELGHGLEADITVIVSAA